MKKNLYTLCSLGMFFILPIITTAQLINDDLANAITINSLPFTNTILSTDAQQASAETDELECNDSPTSWWYEFTPSVTGDYFITSEVVGAKNGGTSNDISLGIYTGNTHPLTQVSCFEWDKGAAFGEAEGVALTAGVAYKIRVGPNVVGDILDVTTRVRNLAIWDGSESSDWSDPDNWSTASVPTLDDVVFIQGSVPNEPIVGNGTMAVAAAIKMLNGIDLTIAEGGNLTINSGENRGIFADLGAGDLIVNGELMIENTTAGISMRDGAYSIGTNGMTLIQNTTSDGIFIESSSENVVIEGELIVNNSNEEGVDITANGFTLGENASLQISNTTEPALRLWEDMLITIDGEVQIEGAGSFGIIVVQDGILNIGSTAIVEIKDIDGDGLYAQNPDAQINIDGKVTLSGLEERGIRMQNGTLNVNSSADLRIEDAGTAILLRNTLTHTLDGTISISLMSIDGIALEAAGQIDIPASAMIDIDTIQFDPIYLDDVGAIININGTLDLAEADDGIDVEDGTMNVGATANINIHDVTDNGIEVMTGTNSGTITISNTGDDGINTASGTFTNNASGTITISNVADRCIDVENSEDFNNSGTIIASECGNFVIEGGTFNNLANGLVQADGSIESSAYVAAANSILAPGQSPGCLEFDSGEDFSNSTIRIEIEGTTPCAEYDQIMLADVFTLTDATLELSGSYVPQISEQFVIILNDEVNDPSIGTFIGLAEGATIIFNNIELSITYSGGNGGNDVVLTANAVVPIELLSFTATAQDQHTLLQWATASELNNAYFQVERSLDGKSFLPIGKVAGAGTTASVQQYRHIDESPAKGTNYYRLKQLDFDGQYEYSQIINLEFETSKEAFIRIYPKPTTDLLNIQISDNEQIERVMLFDAYGKMIWQRQAVKPQISLANLSKGIYFLQVKTANRTYQEPLVKQ